MVEDLRIRLRIKNRDKIMGKFSEITINDNGNNGDKLISNIT